MHRISTETASLVRAGYSHKEAIGVIADAGFDAYDITICELVRYNELLRKPEINPDSPFMKDDYREYCAMLKAYADERGIVCNQAHAPFSVMAPVIYKLLPRSIEIAGLLGCEVIVIHPGNDWTPEENKKMYFELLPLAKKYGMKIATENMWNWDIKKDEACFAACSNETDFVANLKAVDDEDFIACLDIGHAEMRGLNTTAEKMIHALGDKLLALHLHDNDKWQDSHAIPFTMDIDFDIVCKALKDIGYKGDFTLESCHIFGDRKREEVLPLVKQMKEAAAKIREMVLN